MIVAYSEKVYISKIVGQPHLEKFNDKTTTHQIDKGGRNSTKSSKNEIKIPYLMLTDPTCEAVAIRKNYKDHRDTTYAGLKIGFERLNWKLKNGINYPRGRTSPMWMTTDQGNYIHFVGMNDYESQQGARPTRKENAIKIVWMFEITQFDSEQEMNNMISTYIRGEKDWFIVMYEFNPPAKKSHWVYGWLKKMEQREQEIGDVYIKHTNYCDLPEWQQQQWLGRISLLEIENMKIIDYEQYKSIYLGLPANLSGSVYKKWNPDKHIGNVSRQPLDYHKITVGVDYGETDATVFTATGILREWRGARVLGRYYHKNGESGGDKGIIEYGNDFFDFMEMLITEFGNKTIKVYVDSASKHFWSYIRREKARRGISGYIIDITDKRKRTRMGSDAIEERIAITNIMFGADYLMIDEQCLELQKAFDECERDKHGNRKDDGTTDIDSLDSFEYSILEDMEHIMNAILRQRGYHNQPEQAHGSVM